MGRYDSWPYEGFDTQQVGSTRIDSFLFFFFPPFLDVATCENKEDGRCYIWEETTGWVAALVTCTGSLYHRGKGSSAPPNKLNLSVVRLFAFHLFLILKLTWPNSQYAVCLLRCCRFLVTRAVEVAALTGLLFRWSWNGSTLHVEPPWKLQASQFP